MLHYVLVSAVICDVAAVSHAAADALESVMDLAHAASTLRLFFFFFFFNDTATTEIYTLPTRRSSDLTSTESPSSPSRMPATTAAQAPVPQASVDRKSTRLNSSHLRISYPVFCLKKDPLELGIFGDLLIRLEGLLPSAFVARRPGAHDRLPLGDCVFLKDAPPTETDNVPLHDAHRL